MGKELKHLKRSELMEIIYQLKRNEQSLQKENDELRRQLEDKRIAVAEAGSVAEAALSLEGIFAAAQRAADAYLAEIAQRRTETDRECIQRIAEATKRSEEMLRSASQRRDDLMTEAKKTYALLMKYEAAIEKRKQQLAGLNRQE